MPRPLALPAVLCLLLAACEQAVEPMPTGTQGPPLAHAPGPPGQMLEMQGATPLPPQQQLTGLALEAAQLMGRAHMEGGDQAWHNAMDFLDDAVVREPDNAALHNMRGRLLIAQAVQVELSGKVAILPETGRTALLRAIELEPDEPDHRRALVEYLLLADDPTQAIETSQAVLERWPDELMQHAKIGQALLKMGQLDQAQAHFQRAAELGEAAGDVDTWVRALDGLGDVHRTRGESEGMSTIIQALEGARSSGKVGTDSPSASCVFASLGDLYKATGSGNQAAERYAAAADVESTNLGHQLEAARLLLEHGQPVRALLYLERGAGMANDPAYANLEQAITEQLEADGRSSLITSDLHADEATVAALKAFDRGEIAVARLHAERAERLDHDHRCDVLLGLIYLLEVKPGLAGLVFEQAQHDPHARQGAQLGLGHVALGKKDHIKASQLIEPLASAQAPPRPAPDSADIDEAYAWMVWRMAVVGQGWLASNQADHDRALESYGRILEHHPDDPLALLGRGNSLTAQGRFEDASGALERVLTTDPDNRYALSGMGLVHHNRGQHTQAEQLFQQALEGDSSGYTCPYEGLGLVYMAQGRDDDAEQAFRQAISIDPDIEYLKYNGLARIYMDRGRLDEAEHLLRRSMANAPHDPRAAALLDELHQLRTAAPPPVNAP